MINKLINKWFVVLVLLNSFCDAFDNEISIFGTVQTTASIDVLNVGRLDESILFSTSSLFGASVTIHDIGDSTAIKLISNNGELLLLPMSYLIFNDPLIIETPVNINSTKTATLGIDISIN